MLWAMNRREFLKISAYGTLFLAAGGGIVSALIEDRRRMSQEERSRLINDTEILRAQIEQQGTRAIIERLTRSQDLISSAGEALYKTGENAAYWRIFSVALQNSGPSYNHHTPKFWEGFAESAGERNLQAGEAVVQLNNRINQWAAHFGGLGDADKRSHRLEQLLVLHSRHMSDPNGNAQLLYDFERTQLERDIGLLFLKTRLLVWPNIDGLNLTANKGIDLWLNNFSEILSKATGVNVDMLAGAARQANPFAQLQV